MDEAREQRARAQLAAIEACLCAHVDVAGAVAIVRDDRLIAYAVAKPGRAVDEPALRGHLQSTLPAYMVPRHVLVLDALPLDDAGSLDRGALPEPGVARVAPAVATSARRDDRDPRVDYLVGVWSQLLGVDVGAGDNFFDLGGHSMLAVQMANRVKSDTGTRIQLMTLATQTLAQIAAELPATTDAAAPTGFGKRLVGNLRGMLRGSGVARQS